MSVVATDPESARLAAQQRNKKMIGDDWNSLNPPKFGLLGHLSFKTSTGEMALSNEEARGDDA